MKVGWLPLVALFFSFQAFAVIEVGQPVPNQCWTTDSGSSVCLDQVPNAVHVLLFNAGWCGPCNQEFDEFSPRVGEFDGKPVVFLSLSASGWTNPSTPDATFLGAWRTKHHIPASVFVSASPKDAGKAFFTPPLYIPNVVIVDQQGNLAYKAVEPGVDEMFAQIHKLID